MGEIDDKRKVLQHVFNQYDRNGKGELNALEVQMLHGDLRMGGISYPQVGTELQIRGGIEDNSKINFLSRQRKHIMTHH